MATEDDYTKAAQFVLSPLGGGAITALFYPTGCAVATFPCPADEQTNALGWTMSGLVGNVDSVGAVGLGLLIAGGIYVLAPRARRVD